ncbi:nucleotide-diphospho-sugar transferase [Cytophagaceae bacterium DM2B3-1]|uniref:Nucleotide-diphospho-sugar transferase n=1 Tax=Xanthocytophaga flava TaxID=3048013 RepID=A0ABT7CLT2_9BACT|nr:nucleotide-diphospho-sugar transferase [Xanthocytophaga flavus]MDJ1468283.1 nucleotide-diphospho-sugar transferase [Xanthocytophaga flavus]MDJ1494650.1 nucleotide-diphospho-sugar transferase [Xanthocytophaga flavus]
MNSFVPPKPLKTAVLFVVFNRPDTTEVVFEAIRKAKPPRLYVAADGPRPHKEGEAEKSRITREIATRVDWDCELKTRFLDDNVGCGIGPSSAFDWFFSHEEEGIILEDDCLPDQSFFWYCEELLEKYRHDSRIMHITGSNFQNGWKRDSDYSYYFSTYPHEWGWASWRRAWKLFDYGVSKYPEIVEKGYLDGYYTSKLEQKYRLSKIANTYGKDNVNWWDYQWNFTVHINSGLAIVPNVNLIENIGFGEGATHTLSTKDKRAENKSGTIEVPLKHPPFVIRDVKSDERYFKNLMNRMVTRKIYGLIGIDGFDARG